MAPTPVVLFVAIAGSCRRAPRGSSSIGGVVPSTCSAPCDSSSSTDSSRSSISRLSCARQRSTPRRDVIACPLPVGTRGSWREGLVILRADPALHDHMQVHVEIDRILERPEPLDQRDLPPLASSCCACCLPGPGGPSPLGADDAEGGCRGVPQAQTCLQARPGESKRRPDGAPRRRHSALVSRARNRFARLA